MSIPAETERRRIVTGVENSVNHEAMEKIFRDMSWHRRDADAVILKKGNAPPLDTAQDDIRSLGGDYQATGLSHLCSHCGYLSSTSKNECGSCDEDDWLDLRELSTPKTLRYEQRYNRGPIPTSVKVGTAAIHLGIFAALTVWVTSLFPAGHNWSNITAQYPLAGWYWVLVPVLLLVSHYYSLRPVNRLLCRFSSVRPTRWHLPIRRRSVYQAQSYTSKQTVTGRCVSEKTLVAPFSGKTCIGYRVSVLSRGESETHPPDWLLEEARNEPCTLEGQKIGRDKMAFNLAGDPLEIKGDEMKKKFQTYLHQHGLFLDDGVFWVFETVVTATDIVSAVIHPDCQVGVVNQIHQS